MRKLSSYQRSQPDDNSLAHHIISSASPSSASSAAQHRAVPFPGMPWRALPCGAVLCDAVRCCAALRRGEFFAVLTLFFMDHNKNTHPAQLSPRLYIAHSSAAPCGAVPCPAVCCFTLHCASFRAYSSSRYMMRSTRHQVGTGMYVFLHSSFGILQSCLPSLDPYVFFPSQTTPALPIRM